MTVFVIEIESLQLHISLPSNGLFLLDVCVLFVGHAHVAAGLSSTLHSQTCQGFGNQQDLATCSLVSLGPVSSSGALSNSG